MKEEDYELIKECAKSVGRRFRIPPEELIGEGYLAFLDTIKTYKEEKGELKRHLRKGIRWRIFNHIRKYEREETKYTQEDKDLILDAIPDTRDKDFNLFEHIRLTADCLEIIRIAKLNLDFLEGKKPKQQFTSLLRNMGWSVARIRRAYGELRNILKKGRV
jgi:hypothetical protein